MKKHLLLGFLGLTACSNGGGTPDGRTVDLLAQAEDAAVSRAVIRQRDFHRMTQNGSSEELAAIVPMTFRIFDDAAPDTVVPTGLVAAPCPSRRTGRDLHGLSPLHATARSRNRLQQRPL